MQPALSAQQQTSANLGIFGYGPFWPHDGSVTTVELDGKQSLLRNTAQSHGTSEALTQYGITSSFLSLRSDTVSALRQVKILTSVC